MSAQPGLLSTAISTITNTITDVVGSRLETLVHETVMKAMAEMSHMYFPKVLPNLVNDQLDISDITIPPCRLQQLRTFLKKPDAHFSCPEQAVLLELMMRRTQSVLANLGTGSGKTLTVLMQAKLHKNLVTILVLPLSSLHHDLKRRAESLGVLYSRWAPNGKFNGDVQVVSVSIEHLGFQSFVEYVFQFN